MKYVVLASVLSASLAVGAVMLSAHFEYEGDRFLFPALALQLPALAVGGCAVARAGHAVARALRARLGWLHRALGGDRAALAAAVFVVASALASFGTSPPVEQRIPLDAWLIGARTLAQEGTLDLTGVGAEVDDGLAGEGSVAILGRFGHLLPRASPPAVLLAVPFVAAGGKYGILVLNLLAAALAAWAATRVLGRVVPPALAACAVLAASQLEPLAGTLVTGGPGLLAAAAGWLACWASLERRWAPAAVLAVLTAWLADAPWLLPAAVLAVAAGASGAKRVLVWGGGCLALWGFGHLLPRGLLREPIRALARADFVVLTRIDQCSADARAQLRRQIGRYVDGDKIAEVAFRPTRLIDSNGVSKPLQSLVDRPITAFCGIGNPDAFRQTLVDAGLRVDRFKAFADHHHYGPQDFAELERLAGQADAVITTQKDLVKMDRSTIEDRPLWALQIGVEFTDGATLFEETLQNVLHDCDHPGAPQA